MARYFRVASFAFALFGPGFATVASADSPAAPELKSVFPANGSVDVCPDTPLRLVFDGPPLLGPAGRIRITDADTGAVVETIDAAAPAATESIGGLGGFHYHPVIVAGNEALVSLRLHALSYGRTYSVTLDPGVFSKDGWRFSTKPGPPDAGAARLTVSAAGDGDFCTVQGAFDFIPDGNTRPVTVFLRKGTYVELVCLMGKNAITLLGEDRKESIIAYPNNAAFNDGGGNPYAGASPPTSPVHAHGIYHRGVFLAHRCDDLVLDRLTIRNTTPARGSQEEALILNGTTAARAILRNLDLYGHQDTLQINGQAYVTGCHIEGDVDFMWGTGPCFFRNCVCRSLRSTNAYYTQIRNPASNHGFVYSHCTFDGLPGVTGSFLSRIAPSRFPHSEVVLIDCVLGASVAPAGWLLQKGPKGEAGDPSGLHFWEFQSHDSAGKAVDVRSRLSVSRQLRLPEAAKTVADYGNPAYVLGGNWNPRIAPW